VPGEACLVDPLIERYHPASRQEHAVDRRAFVAGLEALLSIPLAIIVLDVVAGMRGRGSATADVIE
jgi:hypothetical protein